MVCGLRGVNLSGRKQMGLWLEVRFDVSLRGTAEERESLGQAP
jgi:hypothetical protein